MGTTEELFRGIVQEVAGGKTLCTRVPRAVLESSGAVTMPEVVDDLFAADDDSSRRTMIDFGPPFARLSVAHELQRLADIDGASDERVK